MTLFDSLVRLSASAAEMGLGAMETSVGVAQQAVRTTFGHGRRTRAKRAPVDGPTNADTASSELANRLLRSALRARTDSHGLGELSRELLEAVEQSFRFRQTDRWLSLPFELPLALAALGIQEAERSLVTAQAVPSKRLGEFAAFVTELFTDLDVYFRLEYREELRRWRDRVEREPENDRARLELGRTLIKCGL